MKVLNYKFFERDTAVVAKALLGKILVKKSGQAETGGIITETEAYYGEGDPASHAFNGITPRSSIMFGRAGIAYVYLCYGMYYLLNAVTEKRGKAGAVLIRALKPTIGIDFMLKRRKITDISNLADGPGKLTISLDIGIKDNGRDLADPLSDIRIIDSGIRLDSSCIKSSARIGIKKGCDRMLRFEAIKLDGFIIGKDIPESI